MRPSGLTTIPHGSAPTGIDGPALSVAVSIGVTEPDSLFATYASSAAGGQRDRIRARSDLIARPALCVESATGVTVPDW